MIKNLLNLAFTFIAFYLNAQIPCVNGFIDLNGNGTQQNNEYPCEGLTLQSYISAAAMGAAEGQDSWGWTDMDGNGDEYAVVGLDNGTAFVNITNPTSPKYLGRLNSHTGSSLWRDVKVYKNHAYIVSDGNGNHGMQIFDLTRLRGLNGTPAVNFTEDGWLTWGTGSNSNKGKAHNIVINQQTGHAYVMGVSPYISGGLIVYNLNPDSSPAGSLTSPPVVGTYSAGGYCHDAQVMLYDGPDPDYQGDEILIGSFSGTDFVRIFKITTNAGTGNVTFSQISTFSYSSKYYTHQGWFTDDKRFFIVGDEVDEENVGFNTRTMAFDLQDLDQAGINANNPSGNPFYTYNGATPAIDHNGYVRGNRFYLANYAAGARILKIDGLYDPVPSMTEVSYFDVFPSSNSASFNGTWNVYPYFESGNLIATGFGNEFVNGDGGLFVLRDPNYDNTPPTIICQSPTVYLNAATGTVTIDETDIDNGSTDDFGIVKWTLTGQTTFTCADVGNTFNVTLTGEDDYGNKSSCVATVTIAAAPTTYMGGGSWSAGTPDIGSHAIIGANYSTTTQPSIDACTCTVNSGVSLTIDAGDYLKTDGDINVSGTLVVEHQGSVVQVDPNADVNKLGGAVINVNLTTPDLGSRDFMILGSPMTAENRTGVWSDAFLVLNHDTSLFVPNPDVAAQFPGAENFADDNYDNWIAYNGAINVGEGYIVRPQSGYGQPGGIFNYTYQSGTLNNGNVDFNVIYNTPGPTSEDNRNASPNVLANPYASAIWALDFINANAMVGEVYFWEHNTPPNPSLPGAGAMNFSMEDISIYNSSGAGIPAASGGSTPNGYIATGQGFGIKASAAGTATFTNTMRRTDNNNTLRDNETADRIWIEVSNEQYEMQSKTLINFLENTTAGLDSGYDSRRLATVLSLYSHLEDGSQEFGIQSREAFESGSKVPLGFSTLIQEELEYQIAIEEVQGNNLTNATVYLMDNLLNTVTILNDNPYTFRSDEGTFDNRFTLMFEREITLGPADSILDSILVFPNPTDNLLSVYSPHSNLLNLEVYDLLGKRLSENMYEQTKGYTLDLTSLETGVYFVHITTENGATTKKVIKI